MFDEEEREIPGYKPKIIPASELPQGIKDLLAEPSVRLTAGEEIVDESNYVGLSDDELRASKLDIGISRASE